MKERMLTGWTFSRVLYLVMGSFIIADSVATHQWLMLGFGVYFAAMGLFAFGCAAGNCYTGYSNKPTGANDVSNIQFEEVKKSE